MKNLCAVVLLMAVPCLGTAKNFVVPTTTLAAQTANNTSAANNFGSQTNGNSGAGNVSKVDIHSLLYSGAQTKIYAHLLLWFGGSNHMNVGYSSTDANQIHRQITDMISRGIDGVIVDWYGPGNSIDNATKLVMAEAEQHPGFTFAIMVDQGALQWDSCSGCTPQQALINQLQYVEQTYVPSKAYLTEQGRPVITNFNIDLSYKIDWKAVNAALSTSPIFLFQNNPGFSHVLSKGSYSWVMPTTTDYGMGYLSSFYNTGMPMDNEQTYGATYKGFNDSLASWGSNRIMSQRCGATWLGTFSEINNLYNSGNQLSSLQLVTWNDYEEATEIESGIANCVAVSAGVSGNSLHWSVTGKESTVDHYVTYISADGQNLMPLANMASGNDSLNLCSYSVPNGKYVLYVQAVGKPTLSNEMSAAVNYTSTCTNQKNTVNVAFGASPSVMTISSGGSGIISITAAPQSGTFNEAIALSCAGLPEGLKCSFSPSSITPGGNAVSSRLTVESTSGSIAAAARQGDNRRSNRIYGNYLLGLGMFGFVLVGRVRRKRLAQIIGGCVLCAVILLSASCGGGTAAGSPAVGNNYAVTVTGSSSSVQLSTTVTVTVR
jgi:hypothetical protein